MSFCKFKFDFVVDSHVIPPSLNHNKSSDYTRWDKTEVTEFQRASFGRGASSNAAALTNCDQLGFHRCKYDLDD